MDRNEHKQFVTLQWLVGVMAVVIIGLVGAWAMDVNGRLSDQEKEGLRAEGRLTTLEVQSAIAQGERTKIVVRLDEILNRLGAPSVQSPPPAPKVDP